VAEFPPLTHTALTVRDLSVSVPWYGALLDAKPGVRYSTSKFDCTDWIRYDCDWTHRE
jgi:hypothetical protein